MTKSEFEDCCPCSELNFKSKNLITQSSHIICDQFDFFFTIKQRCFNFFPSICAVNISLFGFIFCAKINILGCFRPKPYLKMPKRIFFVDQNGCWVEIIKGEMRVESLTCEAAMVTKIVKNT